MDDARRVCVSACLPVGRPVSPSSACVSRSHPPVTTHTNTATPLSLLQECGTEHGPLYVGAVLSLLEQVWACVRSLFWSSSGAPRPPSGGWSRVFLYGESGGEGRCPLPFCVSFWSGWGRKAAAPPSSPFCLLALTPLSISPSRSVPRQNRPDQGAEPSPGGGEEGVVHAIGLLRWLTLAARDCASGEWGGEGREGRVVVSRHACLIAGGRASMA